MPFRIYFTSQALNCLSVRNLAIIAPRGSKEEMVELLASGQVTITSDDLLAAPQLFDILLKGAFVRIGARGPLFLIRNLEDIAPGSRLDRLCTGRCTVVGYVERGLRAQRFEGTPAERKQLRRICAGGLLPSPPPSPRYSETGELLGPGAEVPVGQQLIRERLAARPPAQQMAAAASAQVIQAPRRTLFPPSLMIIPPTKPMRPLYP